VVFYFEILRFSLLKTAKANKKASLYKNFNSYKHSDNIFWEAGGYDAVVSKRLSVGWAGHGHTDVDVGVWAYGPIAEQVKGDIDNTDIAKSGAKVIGADLAAITSELQAKYIYPMYKTTRDGKLLFPSRPMSDYFGITVAWDAAARSVTLSKDANKVEVNVDSGVITLNGSKSDLMGNADNGKQYLPIEVYNKLTGLNLTWDALSERILLNN
jgi:alkaline phosphatase